MPLLSRSFSSVWITLLISLSIFILWSLMPSRTLIELVSEGNIVETLTLYLYGIAVLCFCILPVPDLKKECSFRRHRDFAVYDGKGGGSAQIHRPDEYAEAALLERLFTLGGQAQRHTDPAANRLRLPLPDSDLLAFAARRNTRAA
ncbi:hypothetical protein KZ779_00690 [Escherichia coli]|nr:hypothetical protein [Escherichia coli]